MKNGLSFCLIVLLTVLAAASCSVKEDRSECPSECEVLFCAPDALYGKDLNFEVRGRTAVLHDSFIYGGSLHRRTYYVPKGPYVLMTGNCPFDSDGRYMISEGAQCDSLYTVSVPVVMSGEHSLDTLFLHKDFATVTVRLRTAQEDGLENLSFRMTSNTCGYSLPDSVPLQGRFEYCLHFDDEKKAVFRLPRQADDSLSMQVVDMEGGRLVGEVNIGRQIMESGYSWTGRDLRDMEIAVSLNFAGTAVSVSPWDDAGHIDIDF